MKKWELNIAAVAAGMLLQGITRLEATLVYEQDGWIRSTNAVAHAWVNTPVHNAAPNTPSHRLVYYLDIEMMAQEGSAHVKLGEALEIGYSGCEHPVLFAKYGDFLDDFEGFSTDAKSTSLRVKVQPGLRGTARAWMAVNGVEQDMLTLPLSQTDAAQGFASASASLQGNISLRINAKAVVQGSLFMVK